MRGENPLLKLSFSVPLFKLDGCGDFLVTLAELKSAGSSSGGSVSLVNTEIWVNVSYYNWWELDTRTGWAYTRVYSANPLIKFLGGMVRPFKPGMDITIYVSAVLFVAPKLQSHYSMMKGTVSLCGTIWNIDIDIRSNLICVNLSLMMIARNALGFDSIGQ